jgi:hypothetical protein
MKLENLRRHAVNIHESSSSSICKYFILRDEDLDTAEQSLSESTSSGTSSIEEWSINDDTDEDSEAEQSLSESTSSGTSSIEEWSINDDTDEDSEAEQSLSESTSNGTSSIEEW